MPENLPYGQPVELPLTASVDTKDDLGKIKKYDEADFSFNSGAFRSGGLINSQMYTDTQSGEKCKRFFTSTGNQVSVDSTGTVRLYQGLDNSEVFNKQIDEFESSVLYLGNKNMDDVFYSSSNTFIGITKNNKTDFNSSYVIVEFSPNADGTLGEYSTIKSIACPNTAFYTNAAIPRKIYKIAGANAGGDLQSYLSAADFTGINDVGIYAIRWYTTSPANTGVDLVYLKNSGETTVATNLNWTPNAQITVYWPFNGVATSQNHVILYHSGDVNSGVIYTSTNIYNSTPTFTQHTVPSSGIPRYLKDRGGVLQLIYESTGGTGVENITFAYPSGVTFTPQSPQGTTVFATSTQNNYCNPFGPHGISSATVGGTAYTKVPFSLVSMMSSAADLTTPDQYYLYCAATNNNSKNPDVSSISSYLNNSFISCKTLNGMPVLYTIGKIPNSVDQNFRYPFDPGNPLCQYGDIWQHHCPVFIKNPSTSDNYFIMRKADGSFDFFINYITSDITKNVNLTAREILPGILLFNTASSINIIDTNNGVIVQNLSGIVTSTIYPITKTGGTVTGNLQFSVYNELTNAVDAGLRPEGTALSSQVVDIICFDQIMSGYMFLNSQITSTNGGKILMDDNQILTALSYTAPRVLKQQTPSIWFTLTYISDNRLPVPVMSSGDYFNGGLSFGNSGAILEDDYIGWQQINLIDQKVNNFFRLFGYRYFIDDSKIYSVELTGVDNGSVQGVVLMCQANSMSYLCSSSNAAFFKGIDQKLYNFDGGRNLNLYLDYNNYSSDYSTNSMSLAIDNIIAGVFSSATNELCFLSTRSNTIGLLYDRGGQLSSYSFSGLSSGINFFDLKLYGGQFVVEGLNTRSSGVNYYNTYSFLSFDTSNLFPKFNHPDSNNDTFDASVLRIQTSYLGLGEWKRQRVNRILIRGKGGSTGHYQINTITEDGIYYGSIKTLTPTYGSNAESYFVVDINPDQPACLGMQLKISFWSPGSSIPEEAINTTIFGITFFVSPEGDLQTINHVL